MYRLYSKTLFIASVVFHLSCQSSENRDQPQEGVTSTSDYAIQTNANQLLRVTSQNVYFVHGSLKEISANKSVQDLVKMITEGKIDEAIRIAQTNLQKVPNNIENLRALAIAYLIQRQFDLCSYISAKILRLNPNDNIALNAMGFLSMNENGTNKNYSIALRYFLKSFETNEDNIAGGLNAAYIYTRRGELDKSISLYDQVKSRCGRCAEAMLGISENLIVLERYKEAIIYLNQIDDKKSMDVKNYYLALATFKGLKQPKEAGNILLKINKDKVTDNSFKIKINDLDIEIAKNVK